MAEKTTPEKASSRETPWWRKALKTALEALRTGFGLFIRPASEAELAARQAARPAELPGRAPRMLSLQDAATLYQLSKDKKHRTNNDRRRTPRLRGASANPAVALAEKPEAPARPAKRAVARPFVARKKNAPAEKKARVVSRSVAVPVEPSPVLKPKSTIVTEDAREAPAVAPVEKAVALIEKSVARVEKIDAIPVVAPKVEEPPVEIIVEEAVEIVEEEPVSAPETGAESVPPATEKAAEEAPAEIEMTAIFLEAVALPAAPDKAFEAVPVEAVPAELVAVLAADPPATESAPVEEPAPTPAAYVPELETMEEMEVTQNSEPADESLQPAPIEETAAEEIAAEETPEPGSEVAPEETAAHEPVEEQNREPVAMATSVDEGKDASAPAEESDGEASEDAEAVAEEDIAEEASAEAAAPAATETPAAATEAVAEDDGEDGEPTLNAVEAKPTHPMIRREITADAPFSLLVNQVYEGPLDLLLDLIRKQDIDIYDIPIARITQQFLSYVNQLKSTDVDTAGEFIYMASLLIHIKSKMLLPRAVVGQEDAAEDPRRELVERLLEHERFKNAAQMLLEKQMIEAATWTNPGVREFRDASEAEPEIAADTTDLVRIFREILDRARNRPVIDVEEDSVTVGQMMQYLSRRLTMEDKPISLRRLLSHTKSEHALIAMFLALLELVRMQAILLRQDLAFSEIFIKKHSGFEAAMNQSALRLEDEWR